MIVLQSNGIWHLPSSVFFFVWVIVMVYVAFKFLHQRDAAKQRPFVRSVEVMERFQKQASFVAGGQLVLFGLTALSALIAFFAFNRSDRLFITAAIFILVSLSLLFASFGALQCPVCSTGVRSGDRFCIKCGAQLLP